MPLSHKQVVAALGPVDDIVVAQVIASGASPQELAEARAWVANDEALFNDGHALASGRIGQLVEILSRVKEEEDEDAPA